MLVIIIRFKAVAYVLKSDPVCYIYLFKLVADIE